MELLLPLTIVIPVAGAIIIARSKTLRTSLRALHIAMFSFVAATAACVVLLATQEGTEIALFEFLPEVPLYFRVDPVSILFSLLTVAMWLGSTLFSFDYLSHGEREDRYDIFSLLALGALMGVCFSGNLVTTYIFYEMMTLATFPLVMHEQTKEAVSAGMTYLYYSLAGAFLGLVGIFFLYTYAEPATRTGGVVSYVAGGFLNYGTDSTGLQVAVFLMLVGLGSKVGMFPLHGWLPKAHPVAPAPASALLSGNITKMGILFIIRVVYYSVGPQYLRGTWMQTALLTLVLITIFLGSMLAFREKVMKKRLAYSTVSQTSYILAGIYLCCNVGTAATGAILHIVFHSVIKNLLFLCAGAVIYKTGKTRVEEWKGLGRQMPVTMTAFTIGGLALVGIPPLAGFVSKWQLATGALDTGLPYFEYLVPAMLLVSALLTAGYLMGPAADAWFVAKSEESGEEKCEVSWRMLVPLCVLAAAAILFGLFPEELTKFANYLVDTVMKLPFPVE